MNQELHGGQAMPRYSAAEEQFNMLSHLAGTVLGFAMIIFSLFFARRFETMASGLVFGGSLILLYLASCVYHGLPLRYPKIKSFFQVVDHCSIFLLCAGTCTPFIFAAFQDAPAWQGWIFNLSIWGISIFGIVLLVRDMNKYKKVSIALYVLIGLAILSQGRSIQSAIGTQGYEFLLAGGVIYCIGLVLYAIKRPWMHSIFHVLCLIASTLHCVSVAGYIL